MNRFIAAERLQHGLKGNNLARLGLIVGQFCRPDIGGTGTARKPQRQRHRTDADLPIRVVQQQISCRGRLRRRLQCFRIAAEIGQPDGVIALQFDNTLILK